LAVACFAAYVWARRRLGRDLVASSTAIVHRPIAAVFGMLTDPHLVALLNPQITLVGEREELPSGGFRARMVSRWHLLIVARTELYDPPNRIIVVTDEVQRSLLGKFVNMRVADRLEYVLTPEGENSTQVTVSVTVRRMRLIWSRVMAPGARRKLGTFLQRLDHAAVSLDPAREPNRPSDPSPPSRLWPLKFAALALVLGLIALVAVGISTGGTGAQNTLFQSGYSAYVPDGPAERVSAVSASWTVPTVTCPPEAKTIASQWPGIGGTTTDVQDATEVQDGTQEACVAGKPQYSAWCELYGDGGVNAYGPACEVGPNDSDPVSPGDAITASISISGATWTLSITNTTKAWHWSITFPNPRPGLGQSEADVIVECPTNNNPPSCAHSPLADFGTVRFTRVTADLNGKTAPLTAFSPQPVQTVIGSTLLAAPGRLSPQGGFSDTWHAGT
jgi:hypothetical protein